jgi:hypothetical protein
MPRAVLAQPEVALLLEHARVEALAPLHQRRGEGGHVWRGVYAKDEAYKLRVGVHDDGAAAAEAPYDGHARQLHARSVQHHARLPARRVSVGARSAAPPRRRTHPEMPSTADACAAPSLMRHQCPTSARSSASSSCSCRSTGSPAVRTRRTTDGGIARLLPRYMLWL